MAHMGGEAADDDSSAAGDVEHGVARARRSRGDDHVKRAGVGDRIGYAERRRLTGELIADQTAVSLVRHLRAVPKFSRRPTRVRRAATPVILSSFADRTQHTI